MFMVFEFCDHDLTGALETCFRTCSTQPCESVFLLFAGLMESGEKMDDAQVKFYMHNTLEGLHKNRFL